MNFTYKHSHITMCLRNKSAHDHTPFRWTFYRAKRIKNAIIRQKRPIASDKAKPRMAYEKSCCFRDGFLAYPIIRLPKTVPIPAPLPGKHTHKQVQYNLVQLVFNMIDGIEISAGQETVSQNLIFDRPNQILKGHIDQQWFSEEKHVSNFWPFKDRQWPTKMCLT